MRRIALALIAGALFVVAAGAPAWAQEPTYEEPPPPADPEQPRTVANVTDTDVAPGQAVTVSAPPAFAANAPVTINLARATADGVALQLAVTRTNADGTVSHQITIPDAPPGVYFLYITGEDEDGNPTVALVAIVVGSGEPAAGASVAGDSADAPASFAAASTPVPAAVADVQSDLTPAAEAAVVEAVTQGGAGLVVSPEGTLQVRSASGKLQAAGTLATTGANDISQQVTVGAALLLAGSGLVLLRRRRGGFTK